MWYRLLNEVNKNIALLRSVNVEGSGTPSEGDGELPNVSGDHTILTLAIYSDDVGAHTTAL